MSPPYISPEFRNRPWLVPSVAQLCLRAGQTDRLARIARDQGNLVTFAAALLRPVGWLRPTSTTGATPIAGSKVRLL